MVMLCSVQFQINAGIRLHSIFVFHIGQISGINSFRVLVEWQHYKFDPRLS